MALSLWTVPAAAEEPPSSWTDRERALDVVDPLREGRSWLEGRGLRISAVYFGEVLANVRGGLQTDEAREYRDLIEVGLELDTAKAGLWSGGRIKLQLQASFGHGVTTRYVGALQPVSSIEAEGQVLQLSAVYLRQALWEDRLWVQAGKQDGNDVFAPTEHGAVFLHSSAGLPPTIPIPSYPDAEWGVLGGVTWPSWLSLSLGLFQGDPNGGRSLGRSFDRLRGPFAIAQVSARHTLFGLPGVLHAGAWYSGDRFARLDRRDPNARDRVGSHGLFAVWDQWLWREEPARAHDGQGLALFAQYGWAPRDRSPIEHYVGGGLRWAGAIPGRDRDVLGVAVYHAHLSRDLGSARRNETAVEVLYELRLLPWLAFTVDAQGIHHPGGAQTREAIVLGIRVTVAL